MKINLVKMTRYALWCLLLTPFSAFAQDTAVPDPPPARGMMGEHMMKGQMMGGGRTMGPAGERGPMGKWWKNSDVAQKLKLTDQQIQQLDKKFYDHRLKLIDYQADTEKQDFKLQALLDEDNPDEAQVGAQVDQTLAARGKLEREFTMMGLDLRKVLSVEQWKQLQAIRKERGGPMFRPGGDMGPGRGMRHPGMDHPGMEHPGIAPPAPPSGADALPAAPDAVPAAAPAPPGD
ncbi:MAG TPA: periplasmic heavy metal sensor [Terriglobales bacterium]|nr:periplasmic heavy metal sensor [Terriglobales bacterium]